MAVLNISSAARAAGKDRNTVKRYLKDGRLSSTKDASGKTVVDTVELVRVFGSLVTEGSTDAPVETPEAAPENTAMHQLTIETLVKQLEAAQEREKWLQQQLEDSNARYERLEMKMLPPGEEPGAKKGFFRRLFGG